jgi:hypothetical protein
MSIERLCRIIGSRKNGMICHYKPYCSLELLFNYHIGSNFWKFYLIRTDFIIGELVFLVKVFRLFRLEGFFWCLECGHGRQMYNILFIDRASLSVMPC